MLNYFIAVTGFAALIGAAYILHRYNQRAKRLELEIARRQTRGPVSGSYRISVGDKQTEPLPYDASADDVNAALAKLDNVRPLHTGHLRATNGQYARGGLIRPAIEIAVEPCVCADRDLDYCLCDRDDCDCCTVICVNRSHAIDCSRGDEECLVDVTSAAYRAGLAAGDRAVISVDEQLETAIELEVEIAVDLLEKADVAGRITVEDLTPHDDSDIVGCLDDKRGNLWPETVAYEREVTERVNAEQLATIADFAARNRITDQQRVDQIIESTRAAEVISTPTMYESPRCDPPAADTTGSSSTTDCSPPADTGSSSSSFDCSPPADPGPSW